MANRKNCSLHIVFFLESSSSRSRQSKKDGWNKFSDFFCGHDLHIRMLKFKVFLSKVELS